MLSDVLCVSLLDMSDVFNIDAFPFLCTHYTLSTEKSTLYIYIYIYYKINSKYISQIITKKWQVTTF